MSETDIRLCASCGNKLSNQERCPNCGKPYLESERRPQRKENDLPGNETTLVIPLARTSTSSKKKKETTFIPSKIIDETDFWKKHETPDFPGTGFLINFESSKNAFRYEIKNLGNEFLGFVECENTSRGLVTQVRDAKGVVIGRIEGNPQYTKYIIKDRYNKIIGTVQRQGILKQSSIIEDFENNQTFQTKEVTTREYTLVKNGESVVTILKTSPETYKIEIKNKIDKRIPILSSIIIDVIQRKK